MSKSHDALRVTTNKMAPDQLIAECCNLDAKMANYTNIQILSKVATVADDKDQSMQPFDIYKKRLVNV